MRHKGHILRVHFQDEEMKLTSRFTSSLMPKLSCVHCDTSGPVHFWTLSPYFLWGATVTSMITTALSSYHEWTAGHCVTTCLHVVSCPNDSFALKLLMLFNKILRGSRSRRHRLPEGPMHFRWLLQRPLTSTSWTLTAQENTVHAWKELKQHWTLNEIQTDKLQIQDLSPPSSGRQRNSQCSLHCRRIEVQ